MNRVVSKNRCLWAMMIMLAVIVIDQIVKIWVKTHFYYGESYSIFSWFQLVFIENNGMAFGWEIGSKYLLTILRIVVVAFLVWYLVRIARRPEARNGYLVCLALIIAGAAGNIIDCLFYGLIFDNPVPPATAQLFPAEGGYAPLFLGRVVDMLYFPLCSWTWPAWMPFVGDQHFIFFSPVFNIADSAITVGLLVLIIFYSKQIGEVPFRKTVPGACDRSSDKNTDKEAKA